MNPREIRWRVPRGAVDSHMHIYDSRFPTAESARLTPPDASVSAYLAARAALGFERTVVVQPSTYGADNRCILVASGQLGATARAVITLRPDVPAGELRRLEALGVCGLRFSVGPTAICALEDLDPLGRIAADMGWHIEITVSARRLVALRDALARLSCKIVVDHMGNLPQPEWRGHEAYGVLARLIDGGRTWVKLSGAYLHSASGPPGLDDVAPLAEQLIAMAPERTLWGTNWPHPTEQHPPDDAALLAWLMERVATQAQLDLMLVRNPEEVFGFAPVEARSAMEATP